MPLVKRPIEESPQIWREEWNRICNEVGRGIDYIVATLRMACLDEKDARACLMFREVMKNWIREAVFRDDMAYKYWRDAFEYIGEDELAKNLTKFREETKIYEKPKLTAKDEILVEKFIESWDNSFKNELKKRGIPIIEIKMSKQAKLPI